jgi:hypothetical protein
MIFTVVQRLDGRGDARHLPSAGGGTHCRGDGRREVTRALQWREVTYAVEPAQRGWAPWSLAGPVVGQAEPVDRDLLAHFRHPTAGQARRHR